MRTRRAERDAERRHGIRRRKVGDGDIPALPTAQIDAVVRGLEHVLGRSAADFHVGIHDLRRRWRVVVPIAEIFGVAHFDQALAAIEHVAGIDVARAVIEILPFESARHRLQGHQPVTEQVRAGHRIVVLGHHRVLLNARRSGLDGGQARCRRRYRRICAGLGRLRRRCRRRCGAGAGGGGVGRGHGAADLRLGGRLSALGCRALRSRRRGRAVRLRLRLGRYHLLLLGNCLLLLGNGELRLGAASVPLALQAHRQVSGCLCGLRRGMRRARRSLRCDQIARNGTRRAARRRLRACERGVLRAGAGGRRICAAQRGIGRGQCRRRCSLGGG